MFFLNFSQSELQYSCKCYWYWKKFVNQISKQGCRIEQGNEVSLRIQSECGKIRTRKNSVFGTHFIQCTCINWNFFIYLCISECIMKKPMKFMQKIYIYKKKDSLRLAKFPKNEISYYLSIQFLPTSVNVTIHVKN